MRSTAKEAQGRRSRGVTLLEILISVFLVGLLMTIFANIVTQYSRMVLHQDKKDRSVANIKMALDTVTSEIEEAQEVLIPQADNGVAPIVRFVRYTPALFREKFEAKDTITVTYFLDGKTLYRSIDHKDRLTVYPIAHDVQGFSVRRTYFRLFTVSVSLEDGSRIHSVDGSACLKMRI